MCLGQPHPKEPSRRVRCDSCKCGHRFSQVQETVHSIEQELEHHWTRTFQEECFAFRKKHGAHFDEKYFWYSRRPIIPYPTGRFFGGTSPQPLRARLRSHRPSGTINRPKSSLTHGL